jgi:hypothetical protein
MLRNGASFSIFQRVSMDQSAAGGSGGRDRLFSLLDGQQRTDRFRREVGYLASRAAVGAMSAPSRGASHFLAIARM